MFIINRKDPSIAEILILQPSICLGCASICPAFHSNHCPFPLVAHSFPAKKSDSNNRMARGWNRVIPDVYCFLFLHHLFSAYHAVLWAAVHFYTWIYRYCPWEYQPDSLPRISGFLSWGHHWSKDRLSHYQHFGKYRRVSVVRLFPSIVMGTHDFSKDNPNCILVLSFCRTQSASPRQGDRYWRPVDQYAGGGIRLPGFSPVSEVPAAIH